MEGEKGGRVAHHELSATVIHPDLAPSVPRDLPDGLRSAPPKAEAEKCAGIRIQAGGAIGVQKRS